MALLTSLGWTVVVLVGLTGLAWLARHIDLTVSQRSSPALGPNTFPAPSQQDCSGWPMISVLVAAKDEQAVLEKCLRSMLDQDYPNFEVLVINDRSRDQTGPIAERLAAADSRLRVLHVREGELAEGWFGKNNAMRLGVQAARGQWFCFTDADCSQTSRSSLSQAYQYARANKTEFLSVLPMLVARGFWEKVIQPVCGGIMVFWFRPNRVNDPADRTAYANGAFMLMDKQAYWKIGGHEPVKAEVNEDIHMARLAKQAGINLRVVQNDGLYVARMYEGLHATWRGWSRIFYGSFVQRRRLIVSLVAMFVMGVLPCATCLAGLIGLLAGSTNPLAWAALAAGAWSILTQQSVLWRFYPLTGIPRFLTPTYSLGAAVAVAIIANAIRKVGGRSAVVWRGTTYMGKQRVG